MWLADLGLLEASIAVGQASGLTQQLLKRHKAQVSRRRDILGVRT